MTKDRTILGIDLAGGVLTAACAVIAVGHLAGPTRAAGQRIRELQTEVKSRESEVADLRITLHERQETAKELEDQLRTLGSLPAETPVEQDLGTITDLARSHGLKLGEVSPHSTVEYPGVQELRYLLIGEGRFEDWVEFLASFQKCSFWADVTYVRCTQAAKADLNSSATARTELTVSFYAAAEPEDDPPATPRKAARSRRRD
jgi:Tfp pilus assembly protein PilO